MNMQSNLNQYLKNPDSRYRGNVFWSWNGRLDANKLRRQIREFHSMGLGGFYMHSRVGLETQYLGKEWFECIAAAVDEAEKLSMYSCLYDDDRWASGAAGGLVTSDMTCRARILYLQLYTEISKYVKHETQLGLWAVRLDDIIIQEKRSITSVAELKPGEILFEAYEREQPGESRYNGYSYLDVLNPVAVKRFIDTTHKAYYEQLGEKFGSVIPAIFTDEPHYMRYGGESSEGDKPPDIYFAAWTEELPGLYEKESGWDLVDNIPELFFDSIDKDSGAVRYLYFKTLTELFVNSYTKQIGEWCEAHNIALTGHMLWEDTPHSQGCAIGSAMRHYAYMQIPGIDQLTEYVQLYNSCKQLSSTARQFGKKWRLSEVYGCTGWDVSLAAYKAMADWQYVLGINQRCLHLSLYSLAGECKRDYPASFSAHANFARVSSFMENYFARLGVVLSELKEVRDLLVVNPVESAWTLINAQLTHARKFDGEISNLCRMLLADAIDFDYGDEEHLANHATVEEKNGKAILRLGEAVYRAVLLPQLTTVRGSTLELLEKFQRAGGTVGYIGNIPLRMDGMLNSSVGKFYAVFHKGINELEKVSRRVRFGTPDGSSTAALLYQLRTDENIMSLVVCNTGFEELKTEIHRTRCIDRNKRFENLIIDIFTSLSGEWNELELESGNKFRANFIKTSKGFRIFTSMAALQTRVFILSSDCTHSVRKSFSPFNTMSIGISRIPVKMNLPNTLVLDHAEWRIGNGGLNPKTFILHVDDAVRKALGVPVRGDRMIQPWARTLEIDRIADLELRYAFEILKMPLKDIFLALENPLCQQVEINGFPLDMKDHGAWIDDAIRKLRIPVEWLCSGENMLTLHGQYHSSGSGLEAMYLLGEFGVDKNDRLIKLPEKLNAGDWTSVAWRKSLTPLRTQVCEAELSLLD
ncbi:MAG: hypothetical protein JXR78_02300 [Victivallales bacterium]|nr:hypothetical protein [Victivallales bacterium]